MIVYSKAGRSNAADVQSFIYIVGIYLTQNNYKNNLLLADAFVSTAILLIAL